MRKTEIEYEAEIYKELIRKYAPKGVEPSTLRKRFVPRLQRCLVKRAYERYGAITPAGGKGYSHSFTFDFGTLYFWYNTPDGSTHVEKQTL